uniref:Uncharacterized protein n=1 Tax=Aegilops tauschii subsp. strangulata TaxID=200361 RepID=A0A453HUP5_AEGTS
MIPSTLQSRTFGIREVTGNRISTSSRLPERAAISIGDETERLSGTLASAPARTKHFRISVEPLMAAMINGVSLQLPSTSAPA